jgi:hypothetical protein
MRKLLLFSLALAALAGAQTVNNLIARVTFGTLSSATTTSAFDVSSLTPHKHTLQVVVTGGPATCGIQLEGTLDDVASSPTWANLSGSQSCTSSVTFHVVDRAVTGVRVNLTALSGGTSPTVSVKYVGVQ